MTPRDLGKARPIEITQSERRITNVGLSSSSARLVPKGAVLLSSRAPIGHLGVAGVPLATNQGCKNLVCGDDLSSQFLFHMLRGSIQELQGFGRGNTFTEIPAKVITHYPMPLPPRETQEDVAEFMDAFYLRLSGRAVPLPSIADPLSHLPFVAGRLERLVARRDAAQVCISRSAALSGIVLSSLRRHLFLREMSHGTSAPLGQLCDVRIGATPTRNEPRFWNGEHVWASIADLNDGVLESTKEQITDEGVAHSSVKLVEPGTLLMSFKLTIGKMAVAGVPLYTNEAIVALPIADSRLTSVEYLKEALLAANLSADSRNAIKGRTLNKQSLRQIPIAIPASNRQRDIVRTIAAARRRLAEVALAQHRSAKEMDALMASTLHRALSHAPSTCEAGGDS